MADILEEIQELSKMFNNLFEVEGLGDPAVDVPPSQNKVKRDRKTKDGKVEVVSVEDELFPYEGNKREQFRQKVIATINNMIQGTATLEDLLQLVRQKKAPLKEAMELMEDILSTIDKKYPEEDNYEKHGELYSKALDNQWKEQDAARDREYSVDDWYAKGQTKNQKGELKTYLRKVKQLQDRLEKQENSSKKDNNFAVDKAIKRHNHKKASLKEAMELMEELLGESSHKRKYGNPNAVDYVEGVGTKFVKDYVQKHPEAVSNQDFNDEYNPGEHRQEGIVKQRLEQKIKDNPIGRYTENLKKAAREHSGRDTLKEALDILEAIKDEIKNHKKWHCGAATFSYKGNNYSYTPERGLKKGGKTRDERNPVKQIVDTENKEFDDVRKYKYDLGRQSRTINKKLNKEVKKLEKTEGKGAFPGKTNDTIKKLIDTSTVNSSNRADADKYFEEVNAKQKKLANDAKGIKYEAKDFYNTKKGDSYGVKPIVKTSEALEEAMELMEDLLDKRTKNEKGMEATRKRSDHGAPYRDYINHKELYPHNQGITGNEEKDLKREAKGLYKAIDHYNTWNKEHGYNPHPGPYITGLKCDLAKVKNTLKQINNYKKYGKHEALEEALEIMEAIINEVSIGKWKEAAASSLPRRKEAFEKTVDNAKKSWNNYAKLSKKYPEDEYALYKKAEADIEAQDGAEDKADHAYAVTRLQTHDKANANKAIKAAKKVQDKREDEFGRNPEKRTFLRSGKANQLVAADPVKSRNEAN